MKIHISTSLPGHDGSVVIASFDSRAFSTYLAFAECVVSFIRSAWRDSAHPGLKGSDLCINLSRSFPSTSLRELLLESFSMCLVTVSPRSYLLRWKNF